MARAIVALGSNLGDPPANLRQAIFLLCEYVTIRSESPHYQTSPMYEVDQPDFYNSVVLVETDLGPLPLFKALKKIEAQMGRLEGPRNAARIIDLDVIAYGNLIYEFWAGDQKILSVPHERVAERRFVLDPLTDIDPEAILPGLGKVQDLLARTDSDAGNVRKVKEDAALSI